MEATSNRYIFFCCCATVWMTSAFEIKIGALIDYNVNETQQIFRYAMEAANAEDLEKNIKLEVLPAEIVYGNEFLASKKVCRFFKAGVAAVFGPMSPSVSMHCMNICDAKEIPFIDVRWDAETKPPVINMQPHPDALAAVFVDLVRAWNWKGFTILYESAPWLPRASELLKLYSPKEYTITIRRLNMGLSNNNYRSVLARVRKSEDIHIVLDCSIETLPEILKQAQQVGLMTDYHQFIITTVDMHTIDLEPFQYSGTNITGIRLVDPENPLLVELTKYIAETQESNNEELLEGLTAEKMRSQTALVFDGVKLLTEAFKQLDVGQLRPKKLNCNNFETWENGNSITNFMRNSVIQGLTGEVKFDNQGLRTNFAVDIIELTWSGIAKVGVWNATEGLNVTRNQITSSIIDDGSLKNKTFVVITALTPPYGMLKDSSQQLTGNDRFEGFGIDLIHELSLMLGFNYTFRLQEDGAYGSINNVTKEWNGMIRELLDERADLAITDLTITSERESGVDFTMPFMNLGISILFRKPTKEPPSTFSFMSPFSTEVWMYLGGAYLGVSVCLFVLGRISPSEWDNPYPCIEEPTELENQFSLRNSLWFTIGALLQQGSEIAPKAPSTRAVAAIWWFFTLIMVSSYTANLAAFLTVESVSSPIKSAEDLKDCGDPEFACPVQFGAKKGGSTLNFFKEAEHGTYKNMYTYMANNVDLQTSSNDEGLKMAKEGNYAFLMESSSIEYIIERNCDVTQVGGLLDDKGYGIAMRKDSSYRSALSEGVLRLQEQGKLTSLKIKWWKEKKGGGACSDSSDEGGALALEIANVEGVFLLLMVGSVAAIICSCVEMTFDVRRRAVENKKKNDDGGADELGMSNMYGVFIVLLIGSIFASSYGFLEWFISIIKRSKKYKKTKIASISDLLKKLCNYINHRQVPFREEFVAELKFIAKCHGNTKTVRHRKSSSMDSRQSVTSDRSNHSMGNDSKDMHLKYLDK